MNDMLLAREYHAMALLTPDARVIITSGTGDQVDKRLKWLYFLKQIPYVIIFL